MNTLTGYLTFTTPPVPQVSSGNVMPSYYAIANTKALPVGTAPTSVLITNLGPEPVFVLLSTAAVSTSATATLGSMTMTVASPTSIAVGQAVIGAGIADGTFVIAIASSIVTLSRPTTAVLSTTTVNFVVPVTDGTGVVVTTQSPLALAYVSNGFISAIPHSGGSRSVLNVVVGT